VEVRAGPGGQQQQQQQRGERGVQSLLPRDVPPAIRMRENTHKKTLPPTLHGGGYADQLYTYILHPATPAWLPLSFYCYMKGFLYIYSI